NWLIESIMAHPYCIQYVGMRRISEKFLIPTGEMINFLSFLVKQKIFELYRAVLVCRGCKHAAYPDL
ncbi:MAG: hypothetical protein AAGI66_10000, partial [Cyanobacteria bacterium P01_H01_bin.74]